MPMQIPLEFVIDRLRRPAAGVERRTIRVLTGLRVSEAAARAVWPRILDHKWYMSERMGRDVGIRVAAIDYLEHVEPIVPRSPVPSRVSAPVHGLARSVFADPVLCLHRVLTDLVEAVRGATVTVSVL